MRASTLRWRLTALYSGSLALGFLVLGGLIFALVRYQLLTHHDHALRETAEDVDRILSLEKDCESLTEGQLASLGRIGGLVLFHESDGGRVFYRSAAAERVPVPSSPHTLSADETTRSFETLPGTPPLRIYSQFYESREGTKGVIRVAERLGDVEAPLRSIAIALLVLAPIAVSASAGAGYWLAGNALAPVDSITRLAREIEATSLERRLPPTGVDDELGRLVDTFNQMIERLESSFKGMKRLTEDASHELRSPLARMRGALDVALSRPRAAEEYRETLVDVGEDVDHLRSITEDLLVLARADGGRISLEREEVRLDRIAAEAVDSLSQSADALGVELRARCGEPVVVLGDERWLRQLVAELLDNALKYSPLGSKGGAPGVQVRVFLDKGIAVLSVEDSGPGLPAEAAERVFERFYRAHAEDGGPAPDGSGLGLAIAAWITRAHKGTIAAENASDGGARMVVTFPCSQRI